MKLYNRLIILLVLIMFLVPACQLLEPENENHSTVDRVYQDPAFAEGLLIRAYTYIPTNDYTWDEVATDDAVTNDPLSSHMRMATGEWSSLFNPQNLWDNSNRAILYINHFLDVVDDVPFKWTDKGFNDLFVRRLKGESYALRGMFKFFLLRNHGGFAANDQLLGVPIYNEFLKTEEDFRKPRVAFAEAVTSAMADLNQAQQLLPMDYGNKSSLDDMPPGFGEVKNVDQYNTVFGDFTQQRISGRHVKAIKARLALLSASPAFNTSNNLTLWADAANSTAELLNDIGGVTGLDPTGHLFYIKAQIDRAWLTSGARIDLPEMVWRRPIYSNRVREVNNYPPSLYGNGRVNPTQNLVDAFPMANGYPITDPASNYNPLAPYTGRDPRLGLYIVFNGSVMRSTTITTAVGVGDNSIDALPTSTRTGYYLRKLLREDVNANPSSPSDQQHFNTHIRYTEMFLNYAEAANEAWGPDGTGAHAYSARDVILAIRKRAGIAQPDNYVMSVNTKEAMRQLIRNERRLELCFEGFRFWDLRRWKEDLTIPARGVRINQGTYTYFDVEQRVFDNSYMHYGPLPYNETLRFNLVQNKGWN